MAPVCGCPTPTYRLYCKRQGAGGDYCVTVRDGKLFLTLPNNCDPNQLWHKDQSNKCEFMLVNKATNKPVKYGGNGDQLYLVNKPNCPDKSVLWGENGDITCEYGFIRPLCNLSMVMDAWTGHIADGTKVSIHPQKNSDNQRWKLVRCCKSSMFRNIIFYKSSEWDPQQGCWHLAWQFILCYITCIIKSI